jgi:hypothetical protein
LPAAFSAAAAVPPKAVIIIGFASYPKWPGMFIDRSSGDANIVASSVEIAVADESCQIG